MCATDLLPLQLGLETDPADILNELIRCTRKGGAISIVGVYAGQYRLGCHGS
jgi:threonine dehydrogenase-like Zn-dependent dehydrogenase